MNNVNNNKNPDFMFKTKKEIYLVFGLIFTRNKT